MRCTIQVTHSLPTPSKRTLKKLIAFERPELRSTDPEMEDAAFF